MAITIGAFTDREIGHIKRCIEIRLAGIRGYQLSEEDDLRDILKKLE